MNAGNKDNIASYITLNIILAISAIPSYIYGCWLLTSILCVLPALSAAMLLFYGIYRIVRAII